MPTGAQAAVRPKSRSTATKIFSRFSFLLLVLVLVHFSGSCCRAQPQDEALALINFKSSLLDPQSALFDWNPAVAPCSGGRSNWIGVLCLDGYVWGLQLEKMNLQGRIDVDALQPLKFMRTVSFMGNNFEGPMPDWKKVSAIKALYLSDNQFSGEIAADAFKGMHSLKKVHLAKNRFTGPLPTSLESPKLIELKLQNNQFTGTIPEISSENLKILDLSNNQLEGPIPAALSKMDSAAFAGNKALCGEPLGTPCSSPPPPTPPPAPTPAAAAAVPKPPRKSPIGLILACILLGILILIIILSLLRRSRQHADETPKLGTPMPVITTTTDVENTLPAAVAAPRSPPKAEDHNGGVGVAAAKISDQHQAGKLAFVEETRQKFDLQDLMRASAEVLGSGNFAASYKAVLVEGEALVVKRFKHMNGIAREDFHEHMRRLGRLRHPNLLPLVAYLFRKEEKLLVSDFVDNGSLATLLHGKHSVALKWGNRLKIIKGVAKGLVYLQNEVPTLIVPHGNLKTSNVLLDKHYNPLLMDYALHPIVNASHVHHVLLAYKSPEYAHHGRISRKTDVWCLGTLILETLTGRFVAHGGAGPDLAAWVNAIAAEDAFSVLDKEMAEAAAATSKGQMEKMLRVGITCCTEDADKRWDLEEAVRQIESIQHDD